MDAALPAIAPPGHPSFRSWLPIAELARGGVARVALAAPRGALGGGLPPSLVALKALNPELPYAVAHRERLLDEGRLLARLRHDAIVRLKAVEDDGHSPVLVLEYLEGQNLFHLRHRMTQRGLSWPSGSLQALYAPLLEALDAVHQTTSLDGQPAAVVHRDVSPENVVVTYLGRVVLLDFEIALVRAGQHTDVRGKARYMSPEQARGEPLDGRADLYAVGVMLWEDLARRSPWEGRSSEEIIQQLRGGQAPPSLRTAAPDLPAGLIGLVDRACAADRAARPASAQAMARELAALGRPIAPAEGRATLGDLVQRLFGADRAILQSRIRNFWTSYAGSAPDANPRPTTATRQRAPEAPPAGPVSPLAPQDDAMDTARELLPRVPAVHTVVLAQRDGTVDSHAGRGDPDLLSAIAALTLQQLEEAADLLALGDVVAWSFTAEQGALFVVSDGGSMVLGQGAVSRNPDTTLKALASASGRGAL